MNRNRLLLFICVLIITTLGALSVQAAPFLQTEETPARPAAQAENAIELINNADSETGSGPAAENQSDGNTDTEAETEEITVEAPEAPVPENPQGTITSTAIGFYWKPSGNTGHYDISWKSENGYEGTLEQDGDDWTCQMGRCIVFEELPSGGNYTWTVTAVNEGGSSVSEEMAFSVQTGVRTPDPYRPNTVLSNQKAVTFEWEDTGRNVSAYRVQVVNRNTGLICFDKWFSAAVMNYINGVCILNSTDHFASGTYAWRVQAENESSVSTWSGWKDFSVNCAECSLGTYLNTETAVISPNGTITDPGVSFIWKAVTGALTYQLEIRNYDGTVLLQEDVASDVCNVEICTYQPELEFAVGESYGWSVATYGWNHIFWGSAEGSFTVSDLHEIGEIAFVSPEDHVSLDPDNQQIIWNDPGQSAASFRFGISSSDGSWLFISDLSREDAWCDGITCSVQFQSIPEGEDYTVTVIPYSEFNIPGKSVSMNFNNDQQSTE